MGAGSSKSLTIPIVYADGKSNVSSFHFSQKQKLQIPEPYTRLKVNYETIPIVKAKMDPQSVKVVHGVVGLKNLGNTCYFNTAIHCLSHTTPLLDYFLSKVYEKEINKNSKYGSKGEVTRQLGQLLYDIWKDERCIGVVQSGQVDPRKKFEPLKSFADPMKLQLLIHKLSKRFPIGQQEDCQELLSYLLDMIHEDLNRCTKKQALDCKDYNGEDPKEEWAAESWGEHLKANKSVIVDLFQGQLESTIKCLTCNFKSHKWEPFLFLNLPIKQHATQVVMTYSHNVQQVVNIVECLDLFQKEEVLSGNSQWKCPKCKENRDCKKSIRIWKLPNILIIHLKRFEYGSLVQGKINIKIEFPIEQLDMSAYCVEQENPIYSLYAVAQHHGSLQYGHYIAACKHRDDGNWYMYNDDEVYRVQDIQKMIVNEYAYVLFYQRQTDEIFRQTVSNSKAWPFFQKPAVTRSLLMNYGEDEDHIQGQMDNSPKQAPQSVKSQCQTIDLSKLEKQWGIEKKITDNTQKKFVELRRKQKH